MHTKTEVVVVGGGYAGVTAANRLTRRDDVSVTLINPRPSFVERIRLHQRVAGTHDAVVDYRDVLAPTVTLVVDAVEQIDAPGRHVILSDGSTTGYDYLIYAVGSGSAVPDVPGAAEHAYPIATLEEAQRLEPALDAAGAGAAVTVVGAGPTGIETATELAEQGRAVTLVCDELGPYLHQRGRRVVASTLARLGVTVASGPGAVVTAVTPHVVQLADGREIPSAVTIWSAGFGVPDLATRSGLSTDAVGRLRTDETLTSVDDDRIVAAGDSAAPSDRPFRMSCQAAGQLGGMAGDTVLSRIAGTEPADVAVAFLGQCLSLGRGAGMFEFSRRDDTPIGVHLGGRGAARLAAGLKELVCWSTVKQLGWEARWPGRFRIPAFVGDPRRRAALREREVAATSEAVPVA